MAFHHVPVLLRPVLDALDPRPGETYADGTLGGGGHSEEILRRIGDSGALYGIDRDPAAIAAATERLGVFPAFHPVPGNFHDVKVLLPGVRLHGGLLDLGVSSHQLDTPERGFSYHEDAPLDMRMDPTRGLTAAEYVNTVSEEEFRRVLWEYGDEKWAARIAQILLEKRAQKPLARHSQGRAPQGRGAPRPPDLPGRAHRGERRNRAPGKGAERLGGPALARRAAGGDHLPFHRGPDREKRVPQDAASLRLPAQGPRVRLRKKAQGKSHRRRGEGG